MEEKSHSPTFKVIAVLATIFAVVICTTIYLAIRQGGNLKTLLGVTSFIAAGIFSIIFFVIQLPILIITLTKYPKEKGFLKSMSEGKPFFTSIISADLNFVFAVMYIVIAFLNDSYFYILLAIFYFGILVLRLYIASAVFETNQKRIANIFILISIGIMILGIFMSWIVYYAIKTDFVFIKSRTLFIFNISITAFKLVTTLISLIKSNIQRSFLRACIALIGLSFIIFTAFTIHIAFISLIDRPNNFMVGVVNFSFASLIFLVGLISLIRSIVLKKKTHEPSHESM